MKNKEDAEKKNHAHSLTKTASVSREQNLQSFKV